VFRTWCQISRQLLAYRSHILGFCGQLVTVTRNLMHLSRYIVLYDRVSEAKQFERKLDHHFLLHQLSRRSLNTGSVTRIAAPKIRTPPKEMI
jgi:hypothetical protein